jgi:hypothetical protein
MSPSLNAERGWKMILPYMTSHIAPDDERAQGMRWRTEEVSVFLKMMFVKKPSGFVEGHFPLNERQSLPTIMKGASSHVVGA